MDDQSNQLNADKTDLNEIVRTATHHIFYLAKEKLFYSEPQEDPLDGTEISALLRSVASALVRFGGETVAISTTGDVINGDDLPSGPRAADDEMDKDENIYVDNNLKGEKHRDDTTVRPPLTSISVRQAILSSIGNTSFADHVQMAQALIQMIRIAKDKDDMLEGASLFKQYTLLSSLDKHSARLHDANQLLSRLQESNTGDQEEYKTSKARLDAKSYAEFLEACRSRIDIILPIVKSLKGFIKEHKKKTHECNTVPDEDGHLHNECVETASNKSFELAEHLQMLNEHISGERQSADSWHRLLRRFLNVGKAEVSEDDDKDVVKTTRSEKEQIGAKHLNILLHCSQQMNACDAVARAVYRQPDDSIIGKLTLQELRILKTGKEAESLVHWSEFYEILRTKANPEQLQTIKNLENLAETKLDLDYIRPTWISRSHCEASLIAAALERNQARQGKIPHRKPHLELGMSKRCCIQCSAVLEAVSEYEAAPFTISKSSMSHRIWHANPPPDLPLDIQRAVKNKLVNTLLTGLDSIAIEAALKATRRRDSLTSTSQDNQSLNTSPLEDDK